MNPTDADDSGPPRARDATLVGHEVATRALATFFEAARQRGLAPELLAEGTGYDWRHLAAGRGRIPWSAFVRFMQNAGRIWTDEELRVLGDQLLASAALRPIVLIARLLYSVPEFYLWAFSPNGPAAQITTETATVAEVAPGRLRFELKMRPGYAPSRENFVVVAGSLEAMSEVLGYERAIVGMTLGPDYALYDIVLPRRGGRLGGLRRAVMRPFAGRAAGEELRRTHEALHERYVELQAEVDARRALEEERAGLVRDLETTLAGLPIGCIVVDADGRITRSNPAMEALLGRPEAALRGRSPAELIASDQQTEARAAFARLVRGEPVPGAEWRTLRSDGRVLACEWHHTPLRAPEGRATGCVSTAQDLTERRQLEARVAQAQKMEAVGQLAGGIAHDFNNLLAVILGYTELLAQDLPPDDTSRATVEQIRRAAQRSADFTRQLLTFGRRAATEPRRIELDDVVSGLAGMLDRLIRKDVTVKIELAGQALPVLADPGQLELALVNLAVNARDAMPSGGTLTIGTFAAEIDVRTASAEAVSAGPYAGLRVDDTGVGMDAETRSRLFEPFFTTKEVGQGTGLGLSIVYGVVRAAGGFVRVTSEVGVGSRFEILLPRIEAGERPGPGRLEGAPAGAGEVILVVDDEAALRDLTTALLGRLGYEVRAAETAATAIALARQGRIDLLVTDVVMPDLAGPELAAALREIDPSLPVLFVSGYPRTEAEKIHSRDSAFLSKPFTARQLAVAVRDLLDRGTGTAS